MKRFRGLTLVWLVLAMSLAAPGAQAEDVYYDLDTSWAVSPSDTRIAVQFDTTITPPEKSTFFANHPTLDDTIPVKAIASGCDIYGIDPAFDYDTAVAEMSRHRREPLRSCLCHFGRLGRISG